MALVYLSILRDNMVFRELLANREVRFDRRTGLLHIRPNVTYGEYWRLTHRPIRADSEFDEDDFLFENGVTMVGSAGNTKMRCATFSISAGPRWFGGSCPASEPGYNYLHIDRKSLRLTPREPLLENWVCNECYADGGANVQPTTILKQAASFEWVIRSLADGTFVKDMMAAIERNYSVIIWQAASRRHAGKTPRELARSSLAHPDYLRIHDTGDFFSPAYFDGWLKVIRTLRGIRFWAATRMWQEPWMVERMRTERLPDNLTIRPSAKWLYDAPPRVPGMAAGTTILLEPRSDTYACPATFTEYKSCQIARGRYIIEDERKEPLHWGTGCRACWDAPSMPIAYRLH